MRQLLQCPSANVDLLATGKDTNTPPHRAPITLPPKNAQNSLPLFGTRRQRTDLHPAANPPPASKCEKNYTGLDLAIRRASSVVTTS